jgi:chromosome segregation ATPase
MDVTSIIQSLAVLGSTLAAILAWASKLQWSEEFKKAKEEQISSLNSQIELLKSAYHERLKAKDEQIVTLNDKLLSLKDMTSEKTAEFFRFTKSQLESYNNELGTRVQELEESIKDKEKLIKSIPSDQVQYQQKIEELEKQKQTLENKLATIEFEKQNLEITLNSDDLTKVSSISDDSSSDTSIFSNVINVSSSLGSALLARPETAMLGFLTLKALLNREKEQ